MPQPATTAAELISLVSALRPRLAVFDCDGTLWEGDAGKDFLYWEVERGLLPQPVVEWVIPRYRDYKAGKVGEEEMCGEMVQIHAGLSELDIEAAAEDFFVTQITARVFPEMQELTRALAEAGCELWAVSSTNEWVVRAGARRFGIAPERVLAAGVEIEDDRATDRLVRVPTGRVKASVIREIIGRSPDAVFGNSVHDQAMLELARGAFAIAPNPDLEEVARARGWNVFWPEMLRREVGLRR